MKLAKKPITVAVALATVASMETAFAQKSDLALEEVLVTATRRAKSVNEIPYNITAINGEDLARAGVTGLAGVMNSVPGIVFSDQGPRANAINNAIVLRGINLESQALSGVFANGAVPTVSTYMDNTPAFFNLQLVDLERVEVLRGPQGTLYGSGSLAGTVRFIHNKPNTDGIEGYVGGSAEWLGESSDQTYQGEGAINIPLSDTFALRLAGTWEDRGGVIDYRSASRFSNGELVLQNPDDPLGSPTSTRVIKDADTTESYTLRASLLWEPTDSFSALLVHHRQDMDGDGDNYRDLNSSDYETRQPFPTTFEQDNQLTSLELEADLGFATLTSSTSYTESEIETVRDLGYLSDYLDNVPLYYLFGIGSATREGCGFYGCYPRRNTFLADEPQDREDVTQEFRLVSNGDGNIDWLIGAYYNDQEADLLSDEEIPGYAEWAALDGSADKVISAYYDADINLPPGYNFANSWLAPGGVLAPINGVPQLLLDRSSEFEEYAAYGELTFNISDAWQITGGIRYFSQEFESTLLTLFTNCGVVCTTVDQDFLDQLSAQTGYDVGADWGVSYSNEKDDEDDVIFKLNTSYQIGDHNIYFTWAEGFRHGGANALPVGYDIITQDLIPYAADETENWELGIKGYLMEGQLQYTAAAFFTTWDNPQLNAFVSIAGLPAVVNASEAETQGLELSMNGNVTDRLSFYVGYNYTDAELTDDFAVGGVSGAKGDDLPNIAEHMANGSVDYIIPSLVADFDLALHLDGRYKSSSRNDLAGGVNDDKFDSFSIFNASVSLVDSNWALTLFANNLTDETDAVTSSASQLGSDWESAERPRSYGLRVRYDF